MFIDISTFLSQSEFVLNVRFDEPFRGIIYSEEGFPNCVYVNASIVSQVSYTVKVPLDGCETSLNAEGNLENAVVIQESTNSVQPSDKKYLLTCIPVALPTRESLAMVNFGGVTVENGATTSDVVRARGSRPDARYTVQLISTDKGTPLDPLFSPLTVGDPITYIVRVPASLSDAHMGRCWARDSSSSLELSDEDGCSLQLKGGVWNQFERVEQSGDLIFRNKIKAWAFPTSNEVNIFCNLHICRGRCRQISCTKRRRRHQQVFEANGIEMVGTKLLFTDHPKRKQQRPGPAVAPKKKLDPFVVIGAARMSNQKIDE
ncbi:unnamed protein product [Toxocara canis]|uniref:ZP domain-containing protein n=1 Tax=Toxocara canis TaxID=6265 RepID=A0A183UGQ3_TOXCA|nr:unnamed protein product [Toxocara canis]